MNPIKITLFQNGQEEMIYNLIKRVYDEFVALDYSEEGNNFFYDWIKPSNITKRQINQKNIIIATIDSEIIGMIEVRENRYISLLFVEKNYHGQGIAKKLFLELLKLCKQRNPGIDKFYVHASPFSIPVYRKLGFVETDEMQEEFGIKYLPMEMMVPNI